MNRHVLLLRGVNVGTNNSLRMEDLRAMLVAGGARDVVTYVQSGNAVFACEDVAALSRSLVPALVGAMGRPVPFTLRDAREFSAIASAHPHAAEGRAHKTLCVTFLEHLPTAAELTPLTTPSFAPESLEVRGRELFTHHPNGQGKSPLAAALGRWSFRGAVTTRNWNTVCALRDRLG